MKFKKESYFKSYFYLLILSIAIFLSAFSCNESEEIEPQTLQIKFINKIGKNLSDIHTNKVSISQLENSQETEYITTEYFLTYAFIYATDSKGFKYYYYDWCGTPNPVNEADYLPNGKYEFNIILQQDYSEDGYLILEQVK